MKPTKRELGIAAILFVMLAAANIYTLLFCHTLFDSPLDRVWYILVMAIGYITGLLVLRLRTFFIIAGVVQMLILPIEISSLYLNHQPVSMPYMYWIISTNSTEAGELLSSVGWWIVAVILIWSLYAWLISRINPQWSIRTTARRIGIGLFITTLTAMGIIHAIDLNKTYTAPNKRAYANIYTWSLGMSMGKVFPYDIYLQTFRAFKHKAEIEGFASLSDYRFGITPRTDSDSTLYILVIGEAARYDNFSLNGEYKRKTNPLLARLSNLVLYTHAYAEANATDLSVPLMITRATANDPMQAYREKTVLGAFQEAGYHTAWLSTESSPIQYLHNIFPSIDTVWMASDDALDEVLFTPCKNLMNNKQGLCASNSLIVLHTKGSHLNYQDRYPENFAVFQPCLQRGESNGNFDRQLMINTYDNTILYTDYILHSLIQILDSTGRSACLIYMPDHGENLCDDERKLWVHGSYEGSQWEYHVPLMVWYSDAFLQRYPNKISALKANRDKRITSQVLFHTLCDMADLREVVDARYSLLSDSLEAQDSIFVLNGKGEIIQGQYR